MKKIILLAALAGFVTGGYAQDRDCTCKNAKTQKNVHSTKVVTRGTKQTVPTCFLDKRKNVGIPGCNEAIYGRDNTYSGYYPKKRAVKTKAVDNALKHTDAKDGSVAANNCDVPVVKTATYVIIPPQPCYTYTTQSGIVVKQCPDNFYTGTPAYPPIDYSSKRVYMGYYPQPDQTKDPRLMENRPIEGAHFPDQELYFWGSEK